MKQVIMEPRGAIDVVDLPEPALRPGTILVRNAFSVISPGTERNAIKIGRDSLLTTARARPDLVRRVLDTVRREGVLSAYRKVRARLEELRPLGYASAGTVLAVGPGAENAFRPGDRVACAGAGHASHAEVVAVPANLAARVPSGVALDAAAFATLGAVALHGVRQARPALGERVAVIGLGVLGLLTVQLLRAAGARVIAFDLSPDLARRARDLGAEESGSGPTDDQVAAALAWTEGVGVDGVIVTAASSDDAPMVAAAGMCRERGRVTAVGLVPFGLPRDIAYQKELELTIARSYGPGRYDPAFEERGLDYPIEYVRWTETRNLEAFLHLVAEGRVDPLTVVSHRFPVEEAARANDMLADGEVRPLGIVITYTAGEAAPGPGAPAPRVAAVGGAPSSVVRPIAPVPAGQPIVVGFIGAGMFARSTLLPILKRHRDVRLRSVVTTLGLTALQAQRRFGFERIGTDPELVFSDPDVHLVFIATRHDSHADLAARALQAGKHVFVEKPLAITEEQLARVEAAAAAAPGILMVGFNRRYSPHARALREAFAGLGPLMMTYRVNAGPLPPGHWLNDPEVGGGRIIGEACHFIDLMSYLTGDAPIASIQAQGLGGDGRPAESLSAVLTFRDSSIGQLLYTASGSKRGGKERIEIHAGGATAVIEDFRDCSLQADERRVRISGRGKGHHEEIEQLVRGVRRGEHGPLPSTTTLRSITRALLLTSLLPPPR
jgi:predicted dehydrogenase/threonine dehydrogenase-like Zn-dependent dehydrogenase